MNTIEGTLVHKTGDTVTPLRVINPEEPAISALRSIRDELADMIQRCQSMMLTAAESAPDEEELDAMQDRLDDLRERLEEITEQPNNGE
jgi:ubiquinone biosynthesis protein UbiJ